MGEFFRGWRRKIGMVTLAMACIFAAAWVRSHSHLDVTSVSPSSGQVTFVSVNQRFRLLFERDLPASVIVQQKKDNYYVTQIWPLDTSPQLFSARSAAQVVKVEFNKAKLLWIPYWTIVIPLTLLSACLILSRPLRKSPAESSG